MFIPTQHGLKESELLCYDRYHGTEEARISGCLIEKGLGMRFYIDGARCHSWKVAMLCGVCLRTLKVRISMGAPLVVALDSEKYKRWINGNY